MSITDTDQPISTPLHRDVGASSSPPHCGGEGPGEGLLPRDRAFTLACQGLRSPAIAARLGVPERTVRAWLRATLHDLADEARASRQEQLHLAIARQLEIAAAAWTAYERAAAYEQLLLDRERARDESAAASSSTPRREGGVGGTPRLPTAGARYLTVALAAQREAARLQGCYETLPTEPRPVHILVTRRPDGPENIPPDELPAWLAAHPSPPSAARDDECDDVDSDHDADDDRHDDPDDPHPTQQPEENTIPSTSENAAETATPSPSVSPADVVALPSSSRGITHSSRAHGIRQRLPVGLQPTFSPPSPTTNTCGMSSPPPPLLLGEGAGG